MVKRGTNMNIIIEFIRQNPGCHRRDAWKNLLTVRGFDPGLRENRGRFVSYFYHSWITEPRGQKHWTIDENGLMWLVPTTR